jgi:hypothetical protein
MQEHHRLTAVWHALRVDSPQGAQMRRRAAATAAMATFLLTLLAVAGLLEIVLLGVAVAALGVSAVGAVLIARRHGASAAEVGTRTAAGIFRAASRRGGAARASLTAGIPHVRTGYVRGQAAVARTLTTGVTHAQHQVREAAARAREHGAAWPIRTPEVVRDEALHANAEGARLRRERFYAEAAEQHRVALSLFRDLGDRRSEALTLNSLALALDRADDPTALGVFEQAATILNELGEEQYEGEVIANLALAFRRRGREERSDEVLELALGKLNPESRAYHRIEELRRAS